MIHGTMGKIQRGYQLTNHTGTADWGGLTKRLRMKASNCFPFYLFILPWTLINCIDCDVLLAGHICARCGGAKMKQENMCVYVCVLVLAT